MLTVYDFGKVIAHRYKRISYTSVRLACIISFSCDLKRSRRSSRRCTPNATVSDLSNLPMRKSSNEPLFTPCILTKQRLLVNGRLLYLSDEDMIERRLLKRLHAEYRQINFIPYCYRCILQLIVSYFSIQTRLSRPSCRAGRSRHIVRAAATDGIYRRVRLEVLS